MNVVTGAFGYIGRYIAARLLEAEEAVKTITTHPDKPNPFGSAVEALPYNFDDPDRLIGSLRGARVLYNTYWVRFEHDGATFEQAIRNTATLFECAGRAGVEKIVHISVTNASPDSRLPYYRGKARQEQLLIASGTPYGIVRPTLVFGEGDIFVNNMAWLIRRFPVFPVFGSGAYRLQPVYVGDVAETAIACAGDSGPAVVDAVGPESFRFDEFIRVIASAVKPGARTIHVPPALGIGLGHIIGLLVRDVILTRDELRGLMDGALTSDEPPSGHTRFTEWLGAHRGEIGLSYASELARHFRWRRS